MQTTTYTGKLHKGKVELADSIDLPDGSEVYVVAPVGVEKHVAARKANGWLIDHVGNMVMADDGMLVQQGEGWVWRFHAYLTALTHEPYGPIGYVDVDANTGTIVSDAQTAESMIARGEKFIRST
jgi:hypothetical protein